MYSGKLVFSQLMDSMPMHQFRRCVDRYKGNHHVKSLLLFRPISLYGFCSTFIPGKPARYRVVFNPTTKVKLYVAISFYGGKGRPDKFFAALT